MPFTPGGPRSPCQERQRQLPVGPPGPMPPLDLLCWERRVLESRFHQQGCCSLLVQGSLRHRCTSSPGHFPGLEGVGSGRVCSSEGTSREEQGWAGLWVLGAGGILNLMASLYHPWFPALQRVLGSTLAPSTSSWDPVTSSAPHRVLYPHPRAGPPSRVSKPLRPPRSQALLREPPAGPFGGPQSRRPSSLSL